LQQCRSGKTLEPTRRGKVTNRKQELMILPLQSLCDGGEVMQMAGAAA